MPKQKPSKCDILKTAYVQSTTNFRVKKKIFIKSFGRSLFAQTIQKCKMLILQNGLSCTNAPSQTLLLKPKQYQQTTLKSNYGPLLKIHSEFLHHQFQFCSHLFKGHTHTLSLTQTYSEKQQFHTKILAYGQIMTHFFS